jgi:hypothetical protein
MQSIDPAIKYVRMLKGAPISIFVLMKLIQQPVNAEFLQRTTGYSDKPVQEALLLLEDYGMISRNGRYGWQIAEGAKLIPLSVMLDDPEEQPVLEDDQMMLDGIIDGSRNNSESEKFRVPSSRSINLDIETLEIKDPPLEDPEKLRVQENLAECARAGIAEPKRSELARLPHVDARMIRYHAATAGNIRLAIYRISKGWRVPADWEDPVSQPVNDVRAQTIDFEPEPNLPAEVLEAWQQVLEAVKSGMRQADFETWIVPLRLVGFADGTITVRACNPIAGQWVVDHALAAMVRAAGSPVVVEWEGKR